MIDRYDAAGMTRNPFAHAMAGVHTQAAFVDRGFESPPSPGSCVLVQVIGDKGAGKTTQVQAWRHQVAGPYYYVPPRPYRARWAKPPISDLVYGDEIDRMPSPLRRAWFKRLAKRRATVVIGTHVDLSPLATRHGFTVVTCELGPVDMATLRSIADRRLEAAAIEPRRALAISDRVLAEIHARSAGSIRRAETLLHEHVAAWVDLAQPDRALDVLG